MKRALVISLIVIVAAVIVIISLQIAAVPGGQGAGAGPAEITILHINDTHAHLEDIARRATLVKNARNEVGAQKVLMFDSGDVFMGTPYFNLMKGQADLGFMNTLGYDAMTLGNHEFDSYTKTPQYLNEFVTGAKFPIVSTNLDFSQVPALKDKTINTLIVEKNSQSFGILGLTTEETAEIADPGKNIAIRDHVATAREAVAGFRSKGINKIIALTHIGWDNDIKLAQQVSGIDLILGGHSHTLPSLYPTVVENVEPTLVVQAEAYGKYLGRLDLSFDGQGVIRKHTGALAVVKDAAEDTEYAARLSEYKAPIDRLKTTIAGKTLVDLDGERADIRTGETNFGNLVADAFLDKAELTKASIAIVNGGSIRTSIPAGDISLGQILTVIPFNNDIVTLDITGEQLIAALENGVSKVEAVEGRFPQVAGMRFSWNPVNQPGSRIISVEVMMNGGFQPVDKTAIYRIATNSYLSGGGDGYSALKQGRNLQYLGFIDYDVIREYIATSSPVSPKVEGRITRIQ